MSAHPKESWRPLVVFVLRGFLLIPLFAAVGLLVSVVVSPHIELTVDRGTLNRAREQWASHKPVTYQVAIYNNGFIEAPEICQNFHYEYVITVTNSEVTDSNAPLPCKAIFEQLTIEKSFDQIDQYLQYTPSMQTSRPQLTLDPDYGFVSHFYIPQSNLDSSTYSDAPHSISFEYRDFKALEQ